MAQIVTVTTDPPAQADTPTVTHYDQLATELIGALNQIGSIIPQLQEADLVAAKFGRAQLSVPDQFCATAIAAVEQLPLLLNTGKLDPAAGRNTLQFIAAFRPVLDRLVAFVRSLKFTLNQRKAGLARASLQVYAMTKSFARDERSPEVAAHVDNMRRDLDRRRRPKAEGEARKAAKVSAAAGKEVNAA